MGHRALESGPSHLVACRPGNDFIFGVVALPPRSERAPGPSQRGLSGAHWALGPVGQPPPTREPTLWK